MAEAAAIVSRWSIDRLDQAQLFSPIPNKIVQKFYSQKPCVVLISDMASRRPFLPKNAAIFAYMAGIGRTKLPLSHICEVK